MQICISLFVLFNVVFYFCLCYLLFYFDIFSVIYIYFCECKAIIIESSFLSSISICCILIPVSSVYVTNKSFASLKIPYFYLSSGFTVVVKTNTLIKFSLLKLGSIKYLFIQLFHTAKRADYNFHIHNLAQSVCLVQKHSFASDKCNLQCFGTDTATEKRPLANWLSKKENPISLEMGNSLHNILERV